MNYRWAIALTALGTYGSLFTLFYALDGGESVFLEMVMAFVIGTFISGFVALIISSSRGAERQKMRREVLQTPFGRERLRIMNQLWLLEDARDKFSSSPEFDAAIQQCWDNLARIDKATADLYETELVEHVEEVARCTKEDLRRPLAPLPQRVR